MNKLKFAMFGLFKNIEPGIYQARIYTKIDLTHIYTCIHIYIFVYTYKYALYYEKFQIYAK